MKRKMYEINQLPSEPRCFFKIAQLGFLNTFPIFVSNTKVVKATFDTLISSN